MILSHEHRFIFLKTTKTAGTSVELSLCRYCGPDDVITPVTADDEATRRAHRGLGPQHHREAIAWRDLRPRDLVRTARERSRPTRDLYRNHITAREVRDRVGADVWNRYFKFSFTRNPWDRFVSRYYWNLSKGEPAIDIQRAAREYDLDENWPIFTIDGEIAVDFVGRYESLHDDLATICARIGIPWDGWLPRAKSGHRPDGTAHRELLDGELAEVIATRCAREITAFEYAF